MKFRRRNAVPIELFRDRFVRFVDEWQTTMAGVESRKPPTNGRGVTARDMSDFYTHDHRQYSALEAIARDAGVDEATLRRIYDDSLKFITFDVADRLFCAMGGAGVWTSTPELAELYESACVAADSEELMSVLKQAGVSSGTYRKLAAA